LRAIRFADFARSQLENERWTGGGEGTGEGAPDIAGYQALFSGDEERLDRGERPALRTDRGNGLDLRKRVERNVCQLDPRELPSTDPHRQQRPIDPEEVSGNAAGDKLTVLDHGGPILRHQVKLDLAPGIVVDEFRLMFHVVDRNSQRKGFQERKDSSDFGDVEHAPRARERERGCAGIPYGRRDA